jgi:hypothetical protein
MSIAIKAWFCLTVAVIAAAIADPLVEAASNAGWFGRGDFTDHSNADVVPALTIGSILVLLYVASRVRRALAGRRRIRSDLVSHARRLLAGKIVALLPIAFALQMLVLFAMESAEQFATSGHLLGPTIWLGGPAIVSLCAHALACLFVAWTISRWIGSLCRTAFHLVTLARAFITRFRIAFRVVYLSRGEDVPAHPSPHVLYRYGVRAPPLTI